MKSKNLKSAAAVTSICLAACMVYYHINPGFFQLKIDSLHAVLSDIGYRFSSGKKMKILYASENGNFINTYSGIDKQFFHSGGFLFFRAENDISVSLLAEYSLKYTSLYRKSELEKLLADLNGIRDDRAVINAGQTVFIPEPLPSQLKDWHNRSRTLPNKIRGLYFNGVSAGKNNFPQIASDLRKSGINAVVFDVKDIPGILSYRSGVRLARELDLHEKKSIDDISKMIRTLKNENIYVIARIACFRDELLVRKRPDLAIQSASTGSVWNRGRGEIWLDPTSREAQDYNIELAVEIAELGADEIQFDYIRFPTTGDLTDAVYRYSFGRKTTRETITDFLSRASEEVHRRNANVSIDIFGIVAWGNSGDISKTGQDIKMLSQYADVISPMLYPSHFDDYFRGYANPADAPYYFISEGTKKVSELAAGKAVIRPWLQAFNMKVTRYNEDYIMQQVKAAEDTSSGGFLFWNAKNSYDVVYRAMHQFDGKK